MKTQNQAERQTYLEGLSNLTKTLFQLNPNKSPGPDGFTSAFYKSAWSIIGEEVVLGIQQFFKTSFLPRSLNATILALIPKRQGAAALTDFRPISCCNTLYKLISKLLVSRLKPILPQAILPNQSAFVQGRLLIENTLLASEIVNGYHKNQGPKRVAIKVDISKAFDSIRWDFIIQCLKGMDVPEPLIKWITVCITTPTYSIGYNGMIHGYFKGKKGIRQGDPLSPYLFVIAMNALSQMLNKGAMEGKFGYHPHCQGLKITHLCFADDLLLFTDGSLTSIQGILGILQDFERISGLSINYQKTNFYTSGLNADEIAQITLTLGINHGTLPVRYLGLPLCPKKLTILDCAPLLQAIKSKLNGWASKYLSLAGRFQLLRTVIAGITSFWSSAYILPKKCIKIIDSLSGQFLWKGSIEGHHSAKVCWETVTQDKKNGGLGLRNMEYWNRASAIKLIWILFFKDSSLWSVWFKSKMLQGNLYDYWTTKVNQKNSWMSNKLLKLKEQVYQWIKCKIGNGAHCKFWSDHWCSLGNIKIFLHPEGPQQTGIPRNATLSSLNLRGDWRLPPARSEKQIQIHIILSQIILTDSADSFQWTLNSSNSQKQSTGEIYKALLPEKSLVPWASIIWSSSSIPKHNFLAWLFVQNRSPTRDRLLSWGIEVDPLCLLCSSAPESRDHLFFQCPFSWQVWSQVAQAASFQPDPNWNTNMQSILQCQGNKELKILLKLAWKATLYYLWHERNSRLHNHIFKSPALIYNLISSTIRNRASSIRSRNPLLSSTIIQLWFSGQNRTP